MKPLSCIAAAVALTLAACNAPQQPTEQAPAQAEPESAAYQRATPEPHPFVAPIEQAHAYDDFYAKPAIRFKATFAFGGSRELTYTMTTDWSRIRMESPADSSVGFFDGQEVSVAPSEKASPRKRFDIMTWPYFVLAPYKFSDPGTQWEDKGMMAYGDKKSAAARLTFDAGTGDSPDDWYMVFRDPATGQLDGVAYIVTFGGRDVEKAAEEPHAVVYGDYQMVDGIPFATTYTFHNWTMEEGLLDKIGSVTVSDIEFIDGESIVKPEGAAPVQM